MRYHFNGHFVEEQRRGFAVHHQIEKDYETEKKLAKALGQFMTDYNPTYCYGLAIGISEEPTIVKD